MAFEEVVETLPILRAGKLEALIVKKHGGHSGRSHDVKPGDSLEIVMVHDWPKTGRSTPKVRIIVAGAVGENQTLEARYQATRIRDLTRRNRLSSNPAWPDEVLDQAAATA